MQLRDDSQLAEYIANHLPIDEECASLFVDAAMKGYYSNTINNGMALSFRDRIIEDLKFQIENLNSKIYEINRGDINK